MINAIDKLQAISPVQGEKAISPVSGNEAEGSLFGDIFRSAIQNVKDADAVKTETEYLLSTGQLDNPAEYTIAASKSQLAVELLVQLRNKALEAYSELTRISM